jgi:hypothetical protein
MYTAIWSCKTERVEVTPSLVSLTTSLRGALSECAPALLKHSLPAEELTPLRDWICELLRPHLSTSESDTAGGGRVGCVLALGKDDLTLRRNTPIAAALKGVRIRGPCTAHGP